MCTENKVKSPETTKLCIRCKVRKLLVEFYSTRSRPKPSGACRVCRRAEMSKRYHSCPEVRAAKTRNFQKRYQANPEKFKAKERERYYGLTSEVYQMLVNQQKGHCLICGQKKKLVVDHCHASGKVRGLICQRCNIQVGWFETTSQLEIIRIANYITRPA